MSCCTAEARCAVARQLAAHYYEIQDGPAAPGVRCAAALAPLRAAGAAYTQHLLDAGVITYPTTALPSRPATW